MEKYKARFMAKGYAQKEGIDYEETFVLVARYTSTITMISLATKMGWEIHQMYVKTTFLNRLIEEEVYIEQLEGFETHEKKSHLCKLKKALYGLKQAPREWYSGIDGYLQKMGFVKSDAYPNIYYLVVENEASNPSVICECYFPDRIIQAHQRLQEEPSHRIRHEGFATDVLFPRVGSLAIER